MGKKEKPPAIIMTEGKREIIRQLLSEYDIQTAQDISSGLCHKFCVIAETNRVTTPSGNPKTQKNLTLSL